MYAHLVSLNESPHMLKWIQQVLRKALPFSQLPPKSEGDASLTLACPPSKPTDSLSSVCVEEATSSESCQKLNLGKCLRIKPVKRCLKF